MSNRRDFLRAGVAASTLALTPGWGYALTARPVPPFLVLPPVTDATVRELALRSIDAARRAGATYADVRLSHRQQRVLPLPAKAVEEVDVGVRALVNGYWGFAAGTAWSADEMVRLGREAVFQAKTNALGKQRVVELGTVPVIKDGHWTTPIEVDPFDLPIGEMQDLLKSLEIYAQRKTRGSVSQIACAFERQDKAFASTDGSYCTQRIHRIGGGFTVGLRRPNQPMAATHLIAGAAAGWEYVRGAPLRDEVDRLVTELEADAALPVKPVEVGRYDLVLDAYGLANLADGTLGAATELDRALGYEANAGGTSYLDDPLGMLGSYEVGSPLLTLTADRTEPGGLATVRWDDEGVAPERFTLVDKGVVADFQTSREGAGWLADAYARSGGPVRSHGCAAVERALEAPLIRTPNLTLAPGAEALNFDGLVSGVKKGLAVRGLAVETDFQCLTGFGGGSRVYEIKDGKRVARVAGAAFLFRAPELWKGLAALGGAASQERFAMSRYKGEPPQESRHTVTAVPGLVRGVTTIEFGRRA